MARRALVMIEGTRSSRHYAQEVERLGLHPIILSANPSRFDNLAGESIRVDTGNLDALIHECSRLLATQGLAGITSPSESANGTVGKLCHHFGLPGPNPTSIERCCDKFTQRQLLAEAGVPIPAYRMATNAKEVERSAAEIGLPAIVKPAADTGGSSGVRLCRRLDELAEHTTYLFGEKHVWQSSPRILIEEFVDGPQYMAETMGNELITIGTMDFGPPPHFVYREWTIPAPLTVDEYERIAEVSLSCLRALGLGWGPTDIELRWTERGPVVIEVNPRLGGWAVPQLVRLAHGIDLVTEHIKLVIAEELDLRSRQSQTAAVRFLVAERDGTLDWITGGSQAAAVSGVADVKFYVEPKTPIDLKGDYRDCIGHVVATSPTPAQAAATLQHAVDLIDWSITPFPTLGE
ncbi:acetyl-CoA carboxylase biotin carboxylase subunit family protein [Mesorhizobium sp.]|uniref:ATP-grasp domain-containing protein n=1 Tax=Mesorhizobium sp. TaxID=1871066 RepID=UPI000FE2C0E3|nr:acetyl-CoA carboxylase biotin carboxylase subunit family protein [Mesorhizobium sp.]RWH66525.1 MAG: ATP-grasp domain-containing protein [Mesorhizobium sp.]RWK29581.1 MAG: ATP-grasp domain-containing protein [Mesorhizobium sp.]RWL21056.1 MAG: ATP-grasp domain-containing protein [Mesorhizobium sp.]RWL24165.1 MAG: ATP-grasp domain-containing protein [Mesorhizobium sp.]RWL29292.1 MAG: ATP-grasp domain-containing protein [Mesorhizobium sp.]